MSTVFLDQKNNTQSYIKLYVCNIRAAHDHNIFVTLFFFIPILLHFYTRIPANFLQNLMIIFSQSFAKFHKRGSDYAGSQMYFAKSEITIPRAN